MTDITAALSRARFMLDNLPAGHADRVVCEALLALAAERDAMAKVVEAAEAYHAVRTGMHTNGPQHTLAMRDTKIALESAFTALDSYRAKVQR